MNPETTPKEDIKRTLSELRTMADEIRVQLHLAGMDAKDKWNRDLEPKLFAFEKRAEKEVGAALKTAAHDLREAMKSFRSSIL